MKNKFSKIAKLVRYYILVMSTRAGSGHPTSALSAADLMTALLFGGFFHFDLARPADKNNDRLIFSKGHASPLFYSLFAAAGKLTEKELLTFRKFGSPLEGHATKAFPYTEAATGSLGQGLSIGLGMALSAKYLDKLPYRTFVLLGDGEMAEGSIWESIQLAAHYKLNNLIGILDVNGLGQSGKTMYGRDVDAFKKRISSFGWRTIKINGHNFDEILSAFALAVKTKDRPVMIIAHTIKGKGVSFLEGKLGWHGKTLSEQELARALKELGAIDKKAKGSVESPKKIAALSKFKAQNFLAPIKAEYRVGDLVATRKAYGNALVRIALKLRDMVVLDLDVGNSTYAEVFKEHFPEHYFEMFIAEQNAAAAAVGLSLRGKIPFLSTFSAFLTRAHDQIRMASYSGAHIVFAGSHAGVSIGQDGVSQMGLEDLAMFRSILNSIVVYPADAVSCDKLVEECARYRNISYIRTTRKATPVIYKPTEQFIIGGSKVLRQSKKDVVTVVAAGITLHEALAAYEELKKSGVNIRVIDLYSVKPIDVKIIKKAAQETKAIVTVEDHYAEGGLGEAVNSAIAQISNPPDERTGFQSLPLRGISRRETISNLAVRKLPKSGKPEELLDYEEISAKAIVKKVKELIT